jgi:hypothetical protein
VFVLALAAFLCGGLALVLYAAGPPALVRYFKNADLRRLGKGPTPPISLIVRPGPEEDATALLRQNYPEFEVVLLAPEDQSLPVAHPPVPDVTVRFGPRGIDDARYEIVAGVHPSLHPDPLFLRDIGHALAEAGRVVFPPVVFGPRMPGARLLTLAANSDAFLWTVLTRGRALPIACSASRRLGSGPTVLARRAVRIRRPHGTLRDLMWLTGRAPIRIPASLAPVLLLCTGLWAPYSLPAWLLLGLLTALRLGIAMAVDLRFVWDNSTLRSLPLLPLLWITEPAALVAGHFGRHRMRDRFQDS